MKDEKEIRYFPVIVMPQIINRMSLLQNLLLICFVEFANKRKPLTDKWFKTPCPEWSTSGSEFCKRLRMKGFFLLLSSFILFFGMETAKCPM